VQKLVKKDVIRKEMTKGKGGKKKKHELGWNA